MVTPGRRAGCGAMGLHAYVYPRLYPCGWRCPLHTPAAMAGRPEPPPGPGWPIHRTPPTESNV
ncbi:hypothetical protein [Streptomyces niveus]|uniref:hypothetical protein n=1 Tax=Streptomyces niveus TaxID=193462 RepID=UPI0036A5CD09